MPSQKQLHWSELRVGITVVVAAIALATLIFLMTSAQGLFTRKINLKAYFDNAEGLRTPEFQLVTQDTVLSRKTAWDQI